MSITATNPRNITEGWHEYAKHSIYICWLDDADNYAGWYYTRTPVHLQPNLHDRHGPFSTSELAYEDAIEELR